KGLIASEKRVRVDGREVDLVLALGEVGDLILLEDAVDQDVLRVFDSRVFEYVGTRSADEIVPAEPPTDHIIAIAAVEAVIASRVPLHGKKVANEGVRACVAIDDIVI